MLFLTRNKTKAFSVTVKHFLFIAHSCHTPSPSGHFLIYSCLHLKSLQLNVFFFFLFLSTPCDVRFGFTSYFPYYVLSACCWMLDVCMVKMDTLPNCKNNKKRELIVHLSSSDIGLRNLLVMLQNNFP